MDTPSRNTHTVAQHLTLQILEVTTAILIFHHLCRPFQAPTATCTVTTRRTIKL